MKIGKRIASWLRYLADIFDPPSHSRSLEVTPTPVPAINEIDWGPEACPKCTPNKKCPRHKEWKQTAYTEHDTSSTCEDCIRIHKANLQGKCMRHTVSSIIVDLEKP